ncbi:MAG: signal peptide peptidase SppA [Ignavibacteriaceae bacterium]
MKQFFLPFIILLILSSTAYSQHYYEQNQFALTSPGAMKYGLYGLNNPAVLAHVESPDLLLTWSDENGNWDDFDNWGLFAAVPHFSFALIHRKESGNSVTDYKLSAGYGSPAVSIGIGYGWSSGDVHYFNSYNVYTLSTLIRPNRYLSLGVIGNILVNLENESIFEAAVRPFGNEYLSLFGDYVLGGRSRSFMYREEIEENRNKWSAGAAVEVFPGVRLTGRYFENKFFNAGIQVSFGRAGVFTQAGFSSDGDYERNIMGIRIGAYDRNPFAEISEDSKYLDINLLGGVKYQRYRFFDNSNTLFNLLQQIDAAKNDKAVSGIAINTSGMRINREMIWELREKLMDFKESGKHVIVYFDRLQIDGYHLVSAADKIVMDPAGGVSLEGYLMGRQYYTGTLEKLGIGFTELKYFKYKTANEALSRTDMSEADKEQLSAIMNDYYELAKTDICASRNISPEQFDKLVNEKALFLPQDALDYNLADTLGRWNLVEDLIKDIEGKKKALAGGGSLEKFLLPDDNYWGSKPKIAVIYALGVCAMDEGINARKLVKVIEAAGNDNNIKAIVFRVDSPGGDILPSDIIAEAIKKAKDNKPVIVSQGRVAASGGYVLSMHADTIVAAPNTITGSIGVIGGWYYNKDLKESLGISTDFIKKGTHADLLYGVTIPFTGITLPNRDLTETEKEKAEDIIKFYYDDFVEEVSISRNRSKDHIENIAQGRVWSGMDGLNNGLIDVIGGLDKALKIAEEKADLKNKVYDIAEYPQMPLLDFNSLIPTPFGLEMKTDASIEHLLFRMKNNGLPMPLLPLEYIDPYEP